MAAPSLYRALLHLYPAAFREEYGSQMSLMFAEQLGQARRTRSLSQQAALWLEALLDTLLVAPGEHLHVVLQDLRYAGRAMAAAPSFAIVAVLSLALGIGANTAIFSLWNGVLRSSLPMVEKPEELVILSNPGTAGGWHGHVSGDRNWLSYGEFEQLRDEAKSFSGVIASQSGLASWQIRFPGGEWEEAHERLVSGAYFHVLGVRPVIGRVFTAEDDRAVLPHAVISYEYWQRRFGGRADVLGKSISIATIAQFSTPITQPQTALTIIGVTPRGFVGETAGQQPDVWMPLRVQPLIVPSVNWLQDKPPEKSMWLHVFGRLRPGVALAQAQAETNTIFKNGLESFYGGIAAGPRRRQLLDQRLKLQPGGRGASEIRGDYATSLTALLTAVGMLLFIACANLTNLQLARGAARKPEIALRLSLGASRSRLIRQLVTESLVLALLGGAAGLGVAFLLHGALVKMMVEADRNFRMSFVLSPRMLLFSLAVTLVTAVLFGLLPAWQATRTDSGAALKEGSRGGTGGIGRMRWGRWLVSLQLALSVPLVVGAGLLTQTLVRLQHAELGYSAEHLLLVRIDLHDAKTYHNARRKRLLDGLREELKRMPGVRAVSSSALGLFSGGESTATLEVEGYTSQSTGVEPGSVEPGGVESGMDTVGPSYFSALGVPLRSGREILERDGEGAPKVCVINEAFADRFFAGRNPLGMRISWAGAGLERTVYQVVGVAQNARTQNLREPITPRYFVAEAQHLSSVNMPTFLIRTAGVTAPVLAAVRQAFQRVDATLPIGSAESIEELMAPLTAQDRAIAQLALVFGSVALALVAVGLYGMLSYSVARRQGEIAIRIAVGAKPGRVVGMILSETSGLVVVGLAAGAGLAYAASHLLHSRLYGVGPEDPLTLAVAGILLLLVAFSAAYVPSRRASQLDAMAALRRE